MYSVSCLYSYWGLSLNACLPRQNFHLWHYPTVPVTLPVSNVNKLNRSIKGFIHGARGPRAVKSAIQAAQSPLGPPRPNPNRTKS